MGERDDLLATNDAFYRALSALDLAAMERLWLHADWVRCVHPGWDVLVGWDGIRESFERIFHHTHWIRVIPTEISSRAMGDIAIVACSENITSTEDGDGGVGVAVAQATNIFRLTDDGWRIVVHHSSPAPVNVTGGFSGTIQ